MIQRSPRGFTIVELLIVIVIIAILAAITIVAFNGIQARARMAARVAEMDKIGKAIKLWTTDNDKSLGQGGVGYNGSGAGFFYTKDVNYVVSFEEILRNSGYLTGALEYKGYMISPCTNSTDKRSVVMSKIDPAPDKTVREQVPVSTCSSSNIDSYSGTGYNMNMAKVY